MNVVGGDATLSLRVVPPVGLRSLLWLDPSPRPGWLNMAIDQALLDLAGAEGVFVLRLYRWKPFCLSFGRHEPAARRYGREQIARLGLDTVRRPTGGRAVWHARELTYAVAAPLGPRTLPVWYCAIHAILLAAVRALGAIEARLASRPDRLRSPGQGWGGCFDAPAGGEVVVGNRKVVGSAQVRQGHTFLQHGSLLLLDGQQVVRNLLGQPQVEAPPEAPLAAVLGRPVPFHEAAGAVVAAFGAPSWPELDPGPVLKAAARHADRFRAEEWTWQR